VIASDLARAIDPARWLRDAGIEPDAWQERAMRSRSKRKLWNAHRQAGKSACASAKAIAHATTDPGSLVICVSPSQRQSSEWLRSTLALYARIPGLPPLLSESAHRIEFAGGSRVISLPSSEGTIRGYSKVSLLILDECARIEEPIIAATRPMIALTQGEIIALSTPWGRRGFFYESWAHGGDTWEREQVTVDQCARIDSEFLKEERESLGELMYRQEYLCDFVDNDLAVFPSALIERCFTDEVTPLWS
jgi:Terminase large subunit, T4likevirus-type, N-terminal